MPPIPRKSRRRRMTVLRRAIQKLGPYQSLALLLVPVTLVEPLKLVALVVAGEGHWLTKMRMLQILRYGLTSQPGLKTALRRHPQIGAPC